MASSKRTANLILQDSSQTRPFIFEHEPSHKFNWRKALFQKLIVKFLQGILISPKFFVVVAKFQNLKLAQSINQIRGIRRSPLGLSLPVGSRLIAFFYEKIDGLVIGHLTRM